MTGKTYRAHDFGDEGARQGPIYYFRLTRLPDGRVEYVPYQIDDEAGIGRQLVSGDLNGDAHVDFVVGNKKGPLRLHKGFEKSARMNGSRLSQPVSKTLETDRRYH